MERRFSMKPVLTLLLFVVLLLSIRAIPAEQEVVLVVAHNSPIVELSALDIRKVYLGVSVTVDGHSIRSYRLNNDQRLNQIFMQSVIAMSEKSYERRLLSLTLKYGRPRPTEVDSPVMLMEFLKRNPLGIGYMWKSDAEKDAEIRIVKVLWQSR